jgi:hypothetical protein
MRAYIANVLPRLKEYSARLDNLALFTDQPWVQIDETGDRTVFVFRSEGNELLISKNGNVNTCSWEYLEYMNSLLIEANGEKTLYNQGFMDEAVMILRKDGQADYLLLANENKVQERSPEKILAILSQKYLTADTTRLRKDEIEDQTSSRKVKRVHRSEEERERDKKRGWTAILVLVSIGIVYLVGIILGITS